MKEIKLQDLEKLRDLYDNSLATILVTKDKLFLLESKEYFEGTAQNG